MTGLEGNVITLQDIFVFHRTGTSESGEILGEFIPTGIRPHCADELIALGVDLAPESFYSDGDV